MEKKLPTDFDIFLKSTFNSNRCVINNLIEILSPNMALIINNVWKQPLY